MIYLTPRCHPVQMPRRSRRVVLAISVIVMFVFCIKTLWTRHVQNSKIIPKDFNYSDASFQDKIRRPKNIIYFGQNEIVARIFNTPEYIRNYSAECANAHQKTHKFQLRVSDIQAREMWMKRFPQCICIGQAKAGTRAILEYLSLHPNMATAKDEVKFFVNDSSYFTGGLKAYLDQMPCSTENQITMEKSPGYVSRGRKETPQRIFDFDPAVKLLFAVRNPIDRAVSEYVDFWVRTGRNKGKSFMVNILTNF